MNLMSADDRLAIHGYGHVPMTWRERLINAWRALRGRDPLPRRVAVYRVIDVASSTTLTVRREIVR